MAKLCECGCGQPTTLPTNRFLSGHNKARLTHGHAKTNQESREFSSWRGMIYRCSNSHCTDYLDYLGRGITVCDRWRGKHGFQNFLADVGPRPNGKTLDRWPNVNGNYEPGNVRWATPQEQALNRRKRRTGYKKRSKAEMKLEVSALASATAPKVSEPNAMSASA
jgi:hypothetical protein